MYRQSIRAHRGCAVEQETAEKFGGARRKSAHVTCKRPGLSVRRMRGSAEEDAQYDTGSPEKPPRSPDGANLLRRRERKTRRGPGKMNRSGGIVDLGLPRRPDLVNGRQVACVRSAGGGRGGGCLEMRCLVGAGRGGRRHSCRGRPRGRRARSQKHQCPKQKQRTDAVQKGPSSAHETIALAESTGFGTDQFRNVSAPIRTPRQ